MIVYSMILYSSQFRAKEAFRCVLGRQPAGVLLAFKPGEIEAFDHETWEKQPLQVNTLRNTHYARYPSIVLGKISRTFKYE